MATVPPQPDTTPDSMPGGTPRPDEVAPLPGDVDMPDPGSQPDVAPDSPPPGFQMPSSGVGERANSEQPDVGSTDAMRGGTGSQAGTSR